MKESESLRKNPYGTYLGGVSREPRIEEGGKRGGEDRVKVAEGSTL